MAENILERTLSPKNVAGAASQWWSNERMTVYFKLMLVKILANEGEMLVNDGEMIVNDGEMSIWSYTHFTIIV